MFNVTHEAQLAHCREAAAENSELCLTRKLKRLIQSLRGSLWSRESASDFISHTLVTRCTVGTASHGSTDQQVGSKGRKRRLNAQTTAVNNLEVLHNLLDMMREAFLTQKSQNVCGVKYKKK